MPGVRSRRACTPSPVRTAGTSPTGTSTAAGTHMERSSMNIHTLTTSIGTHRCSSRVYVVPRHSGRSKRTIHSSCQPPPAPDLPRTGEGISTDGGGPAPAPTGTLLP